jgi:hypothetical protein
MTDKQEYHYEESWTWTDKEAGQGTLSLTERTPDRGQSKNNIRNIEYDCTPEDLTAGLEKLQDKLKKSIETYEQFKQKQEEKKLYAKSQGYDLQVSDEMKKILILLDHHKTITELDSLQTTITEAAREMTQDQERVRAREQTINNIKG